jgi:hypothetical protein
MIFPQDGLCYLMQLSTILALNSLRNYLQEPYTKLRDPASKQIFRIERVSVMVFNTTFNNISAVLWWSEERR